MRDPMNGTDVSIYNDSENVGHANGLSELLSTTRNHLLEHPNMGVLRKERQQRNKTVMQVISPSIANHVMGKNPMSEEELAAVCIQSHFRGYLARKQYLELLYEQYEKIEVDFSKVLSKPLYYAPSSAVDIGLYSTWEDFNSVATHLSTNSLYGKMEEAERLEKIKQQVEEGQLLVDNYHLKQEMEENDCLRKNKRRNEVCSAITIQRVWREYATKFHEKLIGLKTGYENHDGKDAENGYCKFNSLAVSPFEDEFYEEDLFHNESEEPLEHYSDDEPDNDITSVKNIHSESELNGGYLSRSLSITSETADLGKELSPPMTDWEFIDNCLKSSGVQSSESQYSPDPKVINRLSAGPDYLQLCFPDDNTLSDEDDSHHEEAAEIKEYVIKNFNPKTEEEIESNSSCDLKSVELDLDDADVKIIKPEELEKPEISQEEAAQVLLELVSVNEPANEEHGHKMLVLRKKLERFSVRHLETQIRDLGLKIKEISDELVNELVTRDRFHTRQDALLMDVEDAVKCAQTKHKLSQNCKK